jgi:transcription-repair coupling factor (superfamily II helicase)
VYRRLSKVQKPGEVADLRRELLDRFGQVPPETEALLDATVLRLLGRDLGVERIMLRGREGRISFRPGVVPPLARLDSPFRDRQVEVEVKRVDPLSLLLRQAGGEPLASTLREAFLVLSQASSERN